MCYNAGDLEAYAGSYNIPVDRWEEDERIMLRETATKSTPWNIFTNNRCNCTTGCHTNRCSCKKQGIDCSSFCHSGKDCKNKKYTPTSTSTTAGSAPPTSTTGSAPPTSIAGSAPPTSTGGSAPPTATTAGSAPPTSTAGSAPPTAPIKLNLETLKPCLCRTRCHSKKGCPCKKADIVCRKSCHPGHPCTNKAPLSTKSSVTDLTVYNDDRSNGSLEEWTECCGLSLNANHRRILTSRSLWLDDQIINAAQSLLKQQHSRVGGFQAPSLSACLSMLPPDKEFVQVVNVCGNHWLALSTIGCQQSAIRIYDSMGGRLPKATLKLVADLLQSGDKAITIEFVDVQQQRGSNDCGLFALAFIASICCGVEPSTVTYQQNAMRQHLLACIEGNEMKPFPSTSGRKPKTPQTEVLPIYCICRLPKYHGSRMIVCSTCNEWYHIDCVEVNDEYLQDLKLDWFCIKCKQ